MKVQNTDTDVLEIEKVVVKEEATKQIILYNDDVNSFQHVIRCLQIYCGHSVIQAEQCALIVHNNGKCSIKNGEYKKLLPICEALLENQLSATIE